MSLRSMKTITGKSWDMIMMSDTVIDRVNILGKDQRYLLVFTGFRGRLAVDGNIKLTGVDGYGDAN